MSMEMIMIRCIYENNTIINDENFALKSSDFELEEHRDIFSAVVETINKGFRPSLPQLLDDYQGRISVSKLSVLKNFELRPENKNDWVSCQNLIVEASKRRFLQETSDMISLKLGAGEATKNIEYFIDERQIFFQNKIRHHNVQNAQDLAVSYITHLEEKYHNPDKKLIKTGFADLDGIIYGLDEESMIIIGGRPNDGKTSLACTIAWNLLKNNIGVGIFSAESSKHQIMNKFNAYHTGIPISKMKEANFTNDDFDKLSSFADYFQTLPCYIDDTTNIDIDDLMRKARIMVKKNGVKALVIDYITKLEIDGTFFSRQLQVAAISSKIKQLNKELRVPIIVCAQIGRGKVGKPVISDLRECGDIEQDADTILLLHRDEKKIEHINSREVFVAKGREHGLGKFNLILDPFTTKFLPQIRNAGECKIHNPDEYRRHYNVK